MFSLHSICRLRLDSSIPQFSPGEGVGGDPPLASRRACMWIGEMEGQNTVTDAPDHLLKGKLERKGKLNTVGPRHAAAWTARRGVSPG